MSHVWDQPNLPHKGWKSLDVVDLGANGDCEYATCEMCGKERIRFVHTLYHPVEDRKLDVGCICAEKMTGDYSGPRDRERKLKNKASRKAKWLKRKWRVSWKGNEYLNVDGHNMGIFPDQYNSGYWKYRIGDRFSQRSYSSKNEAKLALFDHFWKLTQR